MKKKKITKEAEGGITLIALVITIIVLLILAGVSIAMLIGPNGLITKAQEAKTKTEETGIDEQRKLAMLNATLHPDLWYYKEGGKELTEEEFEKLAEDDSEREKYIPIPGGFAPTEIEGEDKVEEGLVIIDTEGNEFVWIECTEEEYNRVDLANAEKEIEEDDYDGELFSGPKGLGWSSWYYNDNERNGKAWTDPQGQVDAAKKSINEFGGFYIARYEAGIPTDADIPFYTSPDGEDLTYKNNRDAYKESLDIKTDYGRGFSNDNGKAMVKDLKPVSKEGVQAWNFISQDNAVIVAENMVTNSRAKSYLVDSQAWNVICKYKLKPEKGTDSKTGKNLVKEDSTAWGNYYNTSKSLYNGLKGLWAVHTNDGSWHYAKEYNSGEVDSDQAPGNSGQNRLELATGLNDRFKGYNIYDMAGNIWEWTTETQDVTGGTAAVVRGGSFDDSGTGGPVVSAHGDRLTTGYTFNIGFRVVLYLK